MDGVMMSLYQVSANNYSPRVEKYQGKDHLIVPVVMMVEGVHNGSAGPLFHSIEELGKYPASWNGIPVSIQHPTENGSYVSANSPDILETQTVGQVFNTYVDGEKLKAECWIDIERISAISPEAYEYLKSKRPLEVSIGVFTDDVEKEGEWNGEEYIAIATNHRPDHLALLPGGTGACSWEDGAGIRVNKEKEQTVPALIQAILSKGVSISVNKVSEGFYNILDQLRQTLSGMDTQTRSHYLEEVYEGYFVYQQVHFTDFPNFSYSTAYYKQKYGLDKNGKVVLNEEEPVEVTRKIVYDTVKTNKYKRKGGVSVDKEKLGILVQSGVFTEADAEWLGGLNAEQLEKLVNACKVNEVDEKDDADAESVKMDTEAMVQALAERLSTPEQYIQIMPEEMRDQMEAGLRLHKEQRAELIEKIVALNVFTEEELQKKSMDELTKLAKMIPAPKDYSLAGSKSVRMQANVDEVLLPIGLKTAKSE